MPEYDPKFDLNHDGKIDDADKDLLLSVYGQLHASSALAQACDFTGVGLVVDGSDWNEFAKHYGAVRPVLRFNAGESKIAKAAMRNPTSKAFDYDGVIYMGTNLVEVSRVAFHLNAGEEKLVSFPVTMPLVAGTYPIYIGVFSGGVSIALYKATEDVQIIQQAAVEVLKAYIRMEYPSVSEAYSGWIGISPVGSEIGVGSLGARVQAGVLLRNPTQYPLKYTCTIYNHHWIEPNNYTTEYLTLPGVEPVKFLGAPGQGNPPTGLPYSGYQYECDMFLPPGGELPPGKTGFVYTDLFYQSRRWNYVYIEITSDGYSLGRTLLYSGWYSY